MTRTASLSLVLVFLATVSTGLQAQGFASRFTIIDSVDYVIDSSTTVPGEGLDWQTLELPMGSRLADLEGSDKVLWMQFDLKRPPDDALYSLYFHRYNLSIEVFLNGEKLGGDTFRDGRFTTSWNHPRLINIQNASWNSETNKVHIRFQASYLGGTFGQIVFGETEALSPLWEDTLFKRVGVNSWLQLIGILVTVLATALWLTRRNDSTYLLLAGMASCWTVLTTHMVVYYNLIDYRYWLPLVHLAMHLFGLLFYKLLAKLNNFDSPILNRLIFSWFLIALIWNQFGPYVYWWMGTYVLHALGNLFSLFIVCRIIHKAIYQHDKLSIAISITVLVQLLFFMHDFLLILFGGDEEWETGIYLTQFAFPLLLIVFAGILLERFRSALSLAEDLNRELEAKVEASRKIIEQSYAKTRQLELDQATGRERIAIYRDLHDDVGSKLLSIVHAGRDNKLGDLARAALESLRNSVSRANSEEQVLGDLLKGIKEETQLRLEGSGHSLSWQQSEDLPSVVVSAENVFNLNQIFRELISNIIRHANADNVTVELSFNADSWTFSLSDDGVGFSGSLPGNGLKNISQRIREIGGTISWPKSQATGFSVVAEIPV